jgi:23S rRNA (cytidine1920-2'-O)/16S rRNA (cytidine1409-2'-O)-methyltransferase
MPARNAASRPAGRVRLDELLVARGLFPTRSRARDAVLRGTVTVAGAVADKPGASTPADAAVTVSDPAGRYVSRAALKLVAGLDAFGFDPAGRSALDLGASTGGFTQVLLERGAAHVVAIDVGHGQMVPQLAADPRVSLREGVNARDLDVADLCGRTVEAIVCDVSFISLRLALPPALALAAPGAFAVVLAKPQFDAGRHAVGKGGLVDPAVARRVADDLRGWLDAQPGWGVAGMVESPIEGGDGNREFLLGAVKDRG